MEYFKRRLTVLTEEAVREAELASAFIRVPPTVPGEHLVMSGGLWGLCPVISKLEGEGESHSDIDLPTVPCVRGRVP